MKKTSYRELIDHLYSLKTLKHLGFRHLQKALERLGNPHTHFEAIHIGGTNGKGSVSLKIAEALRVDGKQVGLYSSPHIACYRERIQINGVKITEEEVEELLPQVLEAAPECTFFEITTMLAFLYFSVKKVPIAVIEVGVGGRLDATNILEPILTAITSVSLDHTAWLGNTLDAIAIEKAGIIKSRVPIVIGKSVPPVIETIALERNAPLYRIQDTFDTYDEENSAVAKKCLEILGVPAQGLDIRPPCRMEVHYPFIFDVAHNPAGFEALFRSLKKQYGWERFRVILGMGKDKDHRSCLETLLPHAVEIFLIEVDGVKEGARIETLKKILADLEYEPYQGSTIKDAIMQAEKDLPILVLGTFYMMAEAKSLIATRVKDKEDMPDLKDTESTN